MPGMNTYSISIRVALDRPPTEDQAIAAARTWTEPTWMTLVLTSIGQEAPHLSVVASVAGDQAGAEVGPTAAIQEHCSSLRAALATVGLRIVGWEAIEARSPAETDRQLRNASIPPMVSAVELAELCGVTPARIYELEGERRKAAERGERHALPAPVVPGYWLKTVAEHYAATRKRKPGPSAKSA